MNVTLIARHVDNGVAALTPGHVAHLDGAASRRSVEEPVVVRGFQYSEHAGASVSLKRVKFLTVAAAAAAEGLSESAATVAVALAGQGFAGDVEALWATAQAMAA